MAERIRGLLGQPVVWKMSPVLPVVSSWVPAVAQCDRHRRMKQRGQCHSQTSTARKSPRLPSASQRHSGLLLFGLINRRFRPLQNCRTSGMRRCHEVEPRNTRTPLVSSGGREMIASSTFRWTRQGSRAASSLAHRDSAACRVSNSTRTRTQIGAELVLIDVRRIEGT